MPRFPLVAGCLLPLLAAVGCTTTHRATVARFDLDRHLPARIEPAPRSGMYKVKYTPDDAEHLRAVDGTERYFRTGDPLGFETEPDGRVVAVARRERLFARLPATTAAGGGYFVWTHKSTGPSRLARNFDGFLEAAGPALAVTALGAVAVAALVTDHSCDCDDRYGGYGNGYACDHHHCHRCHCCD